MIILDSSLMELCKLIAEQGENYAKQYTTIFIQLVEKELGTSISNKQEKIYKIFSFMNWAYANGVWSNLDNTALRRDLMTQCMKSIVLQTASQLSTDKSNSGIAIYAVDFDEEFREYMIAYNERMKELSREGYSPNANTSALCGYEWLQNLLDIDDIYMDIIVPQFANMVGDVAKIESLAYQVNRASAQRKKGFFAKLFGA